MSNNTNISSSFPIELNSIRSTSHVILVSLGLPLNILIAVCIVSFGRLRRKPRYIHWLGISSASQPASQPASHQLVSDGD